jgi:hypothetical protein
MRDDIESCPVCGAMILKNRCTDYGCLYGKLIFDEENKSESLQNS